MEKELKKKRLAKYITVGIFILFAVSCIIGFSIEGADSIFEKKDGGGSAAVGTIEIRCDELLSNMDKVDNDSLKEYIPEDGVILPVTEYEGTTENTVFDVLEYVCRTSDIHMEFKDDTVNKSKYVKGINHLYEKNAGTYSGWKFKVNGEEPSYGSSSVYLNDGDVIQWYYTCEL